MQPALHRSRGSRILCACSSRLKTSVLMVWASSYSLCAGRIHIGDNSALDHCHVTPFSMQPGKMVLKPVHVGKGCVVCLKSTVVGGHSLRDGEQPL